MKASVIVPTYNKPTALKKALEGLCLQRRLPDEVLVADDGSTGETAALISGLGGKTPFPLVHVWHEDKGFRLAKIRNEAIKRAHGEYLIMLDGDCIANRHFVSDHLALAEKGCFVQGKRILLSPKADNFAAPDANSVLRLLRLVLSGSMSNIHRLFRIPLLPARKNSRLKGIKGCNMGFFREDLMAVNGYNESFVGWGREDSELGVRLFNYGIKRKEHPFMAVCFHLWHPSYPRETMEANERLLENAIKNKLYYCPNGIVKK
ncbi:MAG: glycosyltransferase family 2 protein [Thermodesulfovibrionales bacterium]|nr:glycosyltransferase family 2 protein [Thermodesulfovibrionales bacterium]